MNGPFGQPLTSTMDNIVCNTHKKQIIGLRLKQNEKNKMHCLDCIQQQNNASNLTDPQSFLQKLNEKRQKLTQLLTQWQQLSYCITQIIQTEINRFPFQIKNEKELEQAIEKYTSGIFSFEHSKIQIDQFFSGLVILNQEYQNGVNVPQPFIDSFKTVQIPNYQDFVAQKPFQTSLPPQDSPQAFFKPPQAAPNQFQQQQLPQSPFSSPNYFGKNQ